ncbi:MAG: ABC transporter permease [Halothiobacillaceae bacterium]|nr:ABC transporter permease [Halothiobacillaceae bacterium]MDY0050690.1 ABC transporter permease [Halothiobacillaceae bacterium]
MSAISRANAQLFLLWLKRDVKSRYAGSSMGLLWAVLGPVLTIVLFYVLFAFVFQVRVPELAREQGYFYYLLAGILPWLALSEGLSRATNALVAHEQFLQKQVFTVGILPGTAVVAGLLPQLFGSVLYFILLAWADLLQVTTWLWFPLMLAVQLLFTLGLGMALSILAVHVRDLVHAVPLVLQFLFYATPILYPLSMVAEEYRFLFLFNPFACLIMSWQAALLGLPLDSSVLVALGLWTLLLGAGGYALFRVLKPTLGEAL